ncbi:unnamed protein product [Adineta steineri]|uniref:Uncharacterized protein n=1 Tax=Adineta steineri TaxID=433720 RepID=A0A815CKU6_9BILA|nr:unnamed protein product [Adineta steineri]
MQIERELVRSIHFNQQLKQDQKKLIDSCIGMPELIVMQRDSNDKIRENTQTLSIMKVKVDKIEEKLGDMDHAMINIQNTLHLVLNKISK